MSTGQKLLANAFWVYGSQVATVVIQMAYAAATSRLVGADGFAAYAVALAVGALTLLLANGGLGQAVGRMEVLEGARVKSMTAYSGILGLIGAVFLYCTAPIWAALWGAPSAEMPLRLMSLSVLFSPLLGLASGLLRRQGKFKLLSTAIFACNCVGMLVGAAAVFFWRSAESLLVAALVGLLLSALFCVLMNRRLLLGYFSFRNAINDLRFSWKLTVSSLLSYFNGNIGKFAVSNFMTPGALGYWNRADVVTTVPFMQIQNAVIQAVYPEFRHDLKDGTRAKVVWVDLLTLVAWVAFPTAAVGAVLIPPVALILFGAGWEDAIALSSPLAVVAGLQIVSTVLASAVEALGRFRWIWFTQGLLLVIYSSAAVGTFLTQEWYPIILGLLCAQFTQHAVHLVLCGADGYLNVRLLLGRYLRIILVSLGLAGLSWLILESLESAKSTWIILVCLLSAALGAAVWRNRTRLEPVQIARKYCRL